MLPDRSRFSSAEDYVEVALHELGHWTGGGGRWPPKYEGAPESNYVERKLEGGFGSKLYAREELFAEISSMYVCAEIGIPHNVSRQAAYVDHWIAKLREDSNAIFEATRGASQIADYVLSFERALKLVPNEVQHEREREREIEVENVGLAVGW